MTEDAKAARIRAFDAVCGMATDTMALLAVAEVGVFQALLASPATAAELGTRCGVSGWRLGPLLDRVAANGFLRKTGRADVGDEYALVPGDEGLFQAGPDNEALSFATVETTFLRLSRGVEVLRTDEPIVIAGTGGDAPAEERGRFLRYLHERSAPGAVEVAEILCGEPVTCVADLGSGLGTYAAALLHRSPQATAVLVDRPNATDLVNDFLGESGLADRARFVGGDFLSDDFGDGFDLAVVSNIAHNVGSEGTIALLKRLHDRIVPGGRVAVKDLMVQDDRLSPASAGRFALLMAMVTPRGGVFPASEVATWLEAAGFRVVSNQTLVVAEGSYLVVGQRPATATDVTR